MTASTTSFWQTQAGPCPANPALANELDVDVAIIGGGFTGLSTAYHLKECEPSLKVAVLESEIVAHGASGRNAGFVMTLFGVDLGYTKMIYGAERTKQAHHYMERAVDLVGEIVHQHDIACDYELTGFLRVATTPAYERRVKGEIELATRLGLTGIEWLDKTALDGEVRSPTYLGARWERRCALVNPLKLARGLKRVVEELGVQIFEHTPMVELRRGSGGVLVKTPAGQLRAQKVVLATNAYSVLIPKLGRKQIPVFTHIVVTEPLTPAQLEQIGWQHRQGIEDARNFVHYYRLTPDRRLLMGGNLVTVGYGKKMTLDDSPRAFAQLERDITEIFPCLAGHPIAARWGGPASVTLDLAPVIGHLGDERIVYSLGCLGHGVSLTHLNGKTIAEILLERKTELTDMFFVDRKVVSWPPEPLRFLVGRTIVGLARLEDWWHETGAVRAPAGD